MQDQMRDALRKRDGIADRNRRTLRNAKQRKAVDAARVDDGDQVLLPCIE
jgi:hypothetical protein